MPRLKLETIGVTSLHLGGEEVERGYGALGGLGNLSVEECIVISRFKATWL